MKNECMGMLWAELLVASVASPPTAPTIMPSSIALCRTDPVVMLQEFISNYGRLLVALLSRRFDVAILGVDSIFVLAGQVEVAVADSL